jgi:hypothetical protein
LARIGKTKSLQAPDTKVPRLVVKVNDSIADISRTHGEEHMVGRHFPCSPLAKFGSL